MKTSEIVRPKNQTNVPIYSNLDHSLDQKVLALLEEENICAQHAAWEFCGFVYKQNGKYHNEIWRYGSIKETITGDTALDVIEQANEKYGVG